MSLSDRERPRSREPVVNPRRASNYTAANYTSFNTSIIILLASSHATTFLLLFRSSCDSFQRFNLPRWSWVSRWIRTITNLLYDFSHWNHDVIPWNHEFNGLSRQQMIKTGFFVFNEIINSREKSKIYVIITFQKLRYVRCWWGGSWILILRDKKRWSCEDMRIYEFLTFIKINKRQRRKKSNH